MGKDGCVLGRLDWSWDDLHSDGDGVAQAFAELFLIHDWNVRDAWPSWIWSDADGIPRCLTSGL
jgi:hypothetical protein